MALMIRKAYCSFCGVFGFSSRRGSLLGKSNLDYNLFVGLVFANSATLLLGPRLKSNRDQPLNCGIVSPSEGSPSFETIKTGFYKALEPDYRDDL